MTLNVRTIQVLMNIHSLVLEELGVERELMAKVLKLKLQYFGHVARGSSRH